MFCRKNQFLITLKVLTWCVCLNECITDVEHESRKNHSVLNSQTRLAIVHSQASGLKSLPNISLYIFNSFSLLFFNSKSHFCIHLGTSLFSPFDNSATWKDNEILEVQLLGCTHIGLKPSNIIFQIEDIKIVQCSLTRGRGLYVNLQSKTNYLSKAFLGFVIVC